VKIGRQQHVIIAQERPLAKALAGLGGSGAVLIVLRCCGIGFRIAARARSRLLSLCGWRNAPAYGGYGYGGYGYGQRGYFRGGYGGAYRPHYDYHDTPHLDYHPGTFRRHFDHYDYTPGHYDVHRSGHGDRH
jgi:hypothetical protein